MYPLYRPALKRRGGITCTAFAALTALGILACEKEQAPTAPPGMQSEAVAAIPARDQGVTAMGTVPLPVNQPFTGSVLAFGITQNGTGPTGFFRINNAGNSAVALMGQTSGRGIAVRGLVTSPTGRAGVFESTSGTGSQDVLFAKSNGNGTAFHAVANGFGMAGSFEGVRNSGSNTLFASALGTGSAVSAVNRGLGRAGFFVITNSSNRTHALYAESRGIRNDNSLTGGAAVHGVNKGDDANAGEFVIDNPASGGSALFASTNGTGPAGDFKASSTSLAILAQGPSQFAGNVQVFGTLTKSAGSFQIDHPLDPKHKYLSHSFVESPDMLNVYDGTATLDGRGEAVVMLPTYFEALNRDFRYQLTAIGAPGPNLHVSQKIRNNRFVVAGGVPGAEVSWLVTGVRQDAYAEAHRIQVETDKPAAARGVALAH